MHWYNILNCSLIYTLNVCDLGKGQKFSRNWFTCPFTTLGFVLWMKLSIITYLEGSWIIMWSSALIGCFTAVAHFSISHSKQISTVCELVERLGIQPYVFEPVSDEDTDFARMFSVRGMNMIAVRCWWNEWMRLESELWVRTCLYLFVLCTVLPDTPVISVFGLVFSLILTL